MPRAILNKGQKNKEGPGGVRYPAPPPLMSERVNIQKLGLPKSDILPKFGQTDLVTNEPKDKSPIKYTTFEQKSCWT